MKKHMLLLLAPMAACLASCAKPAIPLAGKSFTFESVSTTFIDCSEEEFFAGDLSMLFQNKGEYEDEIKTRFLSCSAKPTSNGKLNIGSVEVSNKTLFNGKEIKIVDVNHETISEYESSTLCTFGVNPDNPESYHFYNRGKVDADGTLILDLFAPITKDVYYHSKLMKFTTIENGTTFADNKLTVNLSTNITVDDSSLYNASSVAIFSLS